MSFTEILSHFDTDAASFTVNAGVDYVFLQRPNNGIMTRLSDRYTKFTWKDNIQILSFGCILPFGFEFYENITADLSKFYVPFVSVGFQRVSDSVVIYPDEPGLTLPFENYEISLGKFYEIPAQVNLAGNVVFKLVVEFPTSAGNFAIKISMINIPAALDTKVFHCPVFAKILHTLPMVGV